MRTMTSKKTEKGPIYIGTDGEDDMTNEESLGETLDQSSSARWERMLDIRSLVCEESLPPFHDATLPMPVQLDARPSEADMKLTKKRSADPLTWFFSGDRASKAASLGLSPTPIRANKTTSRIRPELPPPEVVFLEEFGPYLTYDWSDLGLGTVNGSAAWNKELREKLYRDPAMASVPQISPLDTLQWVQQLMLQSETIPPHEESDIRLAVQMNGRSWKDRKKTAVVQDQGRTHLVQSRIEVDGGTLDNSPKTAGAITEANQTTKSLTGTSPQAYRKFSSLVGQAYQDCLRQDIKDGRLEYQCMRPCEVVERMRLLEQRAAELQEREHRVDRLCQRVGISKEVAKV